MLTAGVDAGSRAIKIVLWDADRWVPIASGLTDQGVDQASLAERLLDRLLAESGLNRVQIARTVATGYGRKQIAWACTTVTEITCHAIGVRQGVPDVAVVIDIGGQDSKVIHLTPAGNVRDFSLNDRCAAGTGRFLEVVAGRLGAGLSDLGAMASESRQPAIISSMCVVFAETEIVGLLACGAAPADIVAGVQAAIASRVAAMTGPLDGGPIVFTGGVALVSGMDAALQRALDRPIRVAPSPQLTGALGAAILAARLPATPSSQMSG